MDLIKIKDSRYTDYENLLLRRDALKKEGEQYALEYIRQFGDLMVEVFKWKIECIQKKKKIAYCQRCANQGIAINEAELNAYIESVMAEYQQQLDDLISDNTAAKGSTAVSIVELKKIKDIYYYLAKKIHPDKRPDLAHDEKIRTLWRQIVIAYNHNCLDDLEELKFKVDSYLASIGDNNVTVEIPDIEEKIRKVMDEVEKIMDTLPYQYKFIVEDEDEIQQKKADLKDELESYKSYSEQLDEVLKQFKIVRFTA